MTKILYDHLWHYSEQFTRDPIQRSELLTMAYVMGKKKMGDKVTPGIMKSVMHYRSKELKSRSAFDLHEVGKSKRDAWNKPERVYLDRSAMHDAEGQTLTEFLILNKSTPLDYCITNDFLGSLSESESAIMEDLAAGYKQKEIMKRHNITYPQYKSLHTTLQEKAAEYL